MEWYIKVLKQFSDFKERASRKEYWMFLVALIPLIGPIWLLILFCKDSQPQENKWDFNPREI